MIRMRMAFTNDREIVLLVLSGEQLGAVKRGEPLVIQRIQSDGRALWDDPKLEQVTICPSGTTHDGSWERMMFPKNQQGTVLLMAGGSVLEAMKRGMVLTVERIQSNGRALWDDPRLEQIAIFYGGETHDDLRRLGDELERRGPAALEGLLEERMDSESERTESEPRDADRSVPLPVQPIDPKAAHSLAEQIALLECPFCERRSVLAIQVGSPHLTSEIADFLAQQRRFAHMLKLQSPEDAANRVMEGSAHFYSDVCIGQPIGDGDEKD